MKPDHGLPLLEAGWAGPSADFKLEVTTNMLLYVKGNIDLELAWSLWKAGCASLIHFIRQNALPFWLKIELREKPRFGLTP